MRPMCLCVHHHVVHLVAGSDILSAVQKMPVRLVEVSCFKRGAIGREWPAATVISEYLAPSNVLF